MLLSITLTRQALGLWGLLAQRNLRKDVVALNTALAACACQARVILGWGRERGVGGGLGQLSLPLFTKASDQLHGGFLGIPYLQSESYSKLPSFMERKMGGVKLQLAFREGRANEQEKPAFHKTASN